MDTTEAGAVKDISAEQMTDVYPYSPSWVNRLISWITHLPLPAWLFYLVLWLVICAVETAIKWIDRTYPVGIFSVYHAVFSGIFVYCLALIHYLNQHADQAFITFHPAFKGNEAEYKRLHYELTTLPAIRTLLAGGLVCLISIPLDILYLPYMQSAHFFTSLGANLYEGFILILIYLIVGALIYQIIHLLHIVDAIYVHWTQINLFQLYPLYALSGLTTRAALGFMLLSYFDVLIQFLSSNQILNYLPALSFTTGAIIIFVWPLFGIHQLLVNEKQRAESEAAHHLEAAINHLYKTLDAGQIESMSAQNSALSGLITTQTAIAKIPTWPWQPDTLRWLLGALLLPTLLWITTRILERIGL